MLAFREERFEEALEALVRYRDYVPISALSKHVQELPGVEGLKIFLQAAVYAELERTDDAQGEFKKGLEEMNRLPDMTRGSDRGGEWHVTYGMETMKREAEVLFKAKGIALPE